MAAGARIGRNDPCPCGSGRKYKRCCLARDEAPELLRLRMRRAEGRLVPQVVAYAHERYGYDLVTAAWWAGRACEPPGMSPVRREAAFTPRIVCRLFPGGLHPAWRLLGIVYRPGDAPYHEPRLGSR